jgi:hypothetical protein
MTLQSALRRIMIGPKEASKLHEVPPNKINLKQAN